MKRRFAYTFLRGHRQRVGLAGLLALSVSVSGQSLAAEVGIGASPLGVTLAGPMAAGLQQRLPSVMQHLTDLGARWFRVNILWSCSEPWHGCVEQREGHLDWSLTDAVVREAEKAQVALLLNVRGYSCGTPCERLNPLYATNPRAKAAAYETFIRELVRRYKGKVRYWQIENEVTARLFWRGTVEEYQQILRAAYRAIKAEDPASQVLLAGIPTDLVDVIDVRNARDPRFRHRSFAAAEVNAWKAIIANAKDHFDILDLHLYSAIDSMARRIDLYRAHLRSLGAAKPIWVTETGGPDTRNPFGDPRYFDAAPPAGALESEVVMRLVHALAAGAERVFWFHLLGDNAADAFARMGLVQAQGRTPAFATFGLSATKLAGFTAARRIDAGPGISAYQFRRPAGDLYVLWSDRPASMKLPVAKPNVQVTDVSGRTTQRDPGRLSLGASPIFVEPVN